MLNSPAYQSQSELSVYSAHTELTTEQYLSGSASCDETPCLESDVTVAMATEEETVGCDNRHMTVVELSPESR